MKRLSLLLLALINLPAADVVTVNPDGTVIVAGTAAMTAPAAGEVRMTAGRVATGTAFESWLGGLVQGTWAADSLGPFLQWRQAGKTFSIYDEAGGAQFVVTKAPPTGVTAGRVVIGGGYIWAGANQLNMRPSSDVPIEIVNRQTTGGIDLYPDGIVKAVQVSKTATTFAGTVITPAASTAAPSIRLPHGAAPSAPVNGDLWTTSTGLYARINGVTIGPLGVGGGGGGGSFAPVRVATTGNIALSGLQTVDGVALAAGDRVLVRSQTLPAEQGIYLASAAAWTRAPDADSSSEIVHGNLVQVNEGGSFPGIVWRCASAGVVLGSSPVHWRPINLAVYGELTNNPYISLPSGAVAKLSSGVGGSGSPLVDSTSARLTIRTGGAGKYVIELLGETDYYEGFGPPILQVRKGGSTIICNPVQYLNGSGAGTQRYTCASRKIISLNEGEYLELYGSGNGTSLATISTLSITRLGE